jgi:hypothetical protein
MGDNRPLNGTEEEEAGGRSPLDGMCLATKKLHLASHLRWGKVIIKKKRASKDRACLYLPTIFLPSNTQKMKGEEWKRGR